MAWNRLGLEYRIKDELGIERSVDDGNLTNTMIYDAIGDTLKIVADDCHLFPVRRRIAMIADQWEYPVPDDVGKIISIWYIDSNGTRLPVRYLSPQQFMNNLDPDDTGSEPIYFCYPYFQAPIIQIYVNAPPVYDYISKSYVTTGSIRTVIDSGANFGLTLDGTRIEPGFVVHNLTDDSYGYVEGLDITTNKVTGTADPSTDSNTLVDAAGDFVNNGVAVGDIICTPSSGVVTSYGFVTAVTATQLTYEKIQGDASMFASTDTYKVGIATEIRLSTATPHPGLRSGATNDFTVGDAKASITGTTFTATTVTGSSTSGAEADDIAIASGGSHGLITDVDDNELTVNMWIGGQPTDAETVTVKECDQYQIENKFRTQKVLWINPPVENSDDVGSESLEILFSGYPMLPDEDDDPIEIPEMPYSPAIMKCLFWQCLKKKGNASQAEVIAAETIYRQGVKPFMQDINAPPSTGKLTALNNRRGRSGRIGYKDQGPSGALWNLEV